jgi:cell division protein FtsB
LSNIGLTEIVVSIISATMAGGLSYIIQIKKNRRDDFSSLIEVYQSDNSRLRNEVEKLNSKIEKLEQENYSITEEIRFLRNLLDKQP